MVLDIANEILKLNKELEEPLDIYLTRYSDTLISLSDRTKLARSLQADIFVSLHGNHSDNSDARGIEIYVNDQKSRYSKPAIWLAFQLQENLHRKLGFESRGVKFANFQVLWETLSYCPAVLMEIAFLSNQEEAAYLLQKQNIRVMALIILSALEKHLKVPSSII